MKKKGILKKDVSTRRTGEGCAYPESVRGIPACLPMMVQEQLSVIRAITVSVHSRMEKNVTVIFRHPIILEQDILSGNS